MKRHHIYLAAVGVVFAALAVVFLFFPRSRFSEVERRELATFPDFDTERLLSGDLTADISQWFSDSQPFRDRFMTMSMNVKDKLALRRGGEDEFTYHEGADITAGMLAAAPDAAEAPAESEAEAKTDADSAKTAAPAEEEETASRKNGIIVVGKAPKARAMSLFGGGARGGAAYARTANQLQRELPGVQVYVMVIPTASEFYCPEKIRSSGRVGSQIAYAKHLNTQLDPGIKPVDVITPISQHTDEDIYLRTDHHWAPRAAYYAARELARVAGVPFADLSQYDTKTVPGFVGTMYGYSGDIAVKNSPEDFVYYTPKRTDYTTTYISFNLDSAFHITGESKPRQGKFFHNMRGGTAYSSFMGGDVHLVKVNTGVHNGRRIAILKDSFGNAIPGYLFSSFEEVHVIDFRYFPRNLKKYVADNGITDLAMCNNSFLAYGDAASAKYRQMLTGNGTPVRYRVKEKKPAPADSAKTSVPAENTQTPAESPAMEEPKEVPAAEEPVVEEPVVEEPNP